ncbi:MAG: serine hydrolase [Parasphingopyxis sp.]|nr:class A beta-lactamase-related serine hydrolase [Sphingomonadales bacterium]
MLARWRRGLGITLLAVVTAACAGAVPHARPAPHVSNAPHVERPFLGRPDPRPAPQIVEGPSPELESAIQALGRGFNGSVGIAVRDVEQGWTVAWNGGRYMPQQSVSKTWVAMTLLDAVDRGQLSLDQSVRVRPEDQVVFHQPMAAQLGSGGITTSLRELFTEALTRSDNLANDKLLWTAGGPEAVRGFFERNRLYGLRFGPGERLLQSGIAGVEWRQSYAGRAFYTARANVPASVRRSAMDRYLADPVDGATAEGTVDALARLVRGELLSPQSTALMINTMRASRTGPQRLRGGVPQGWLFGHKTGTGQNLNGMTAGYNDIGIVTAPDGTSYAVAVLIGSTRVGIPERQRLMQAVMGQVVSHHLRRRYELFTRGAYNR